MSESSEAFSAEKTLSAGDSGSVSFELSLPTGYLPIIQYAYVSADGFYIIGWGFTVSNSVYSAFVRVKNPNSSESSRTVYLGVEYIKTSSV